jgi:hypothetical protein
MHIAVRRYTAEPEVLRDLKDRIERDFFPQLKHVNGFIAYYVVSTGTNTFDTISCFEDQEGERKSTQLAAEFVQRTWPNHQIERVTLDEGPCLLEHHAPVPA